MANKNKTITLHDVTVGIGAVFALMCILLIMFTSRQSPYLEIDQQGGEIDCSDLIDDMRDGNMSLGGYYFGLRSHQGLSGAPEFRAMETPAHYEKNSGYTFKSCREELDKVTESWCKMQLEKIPHEYYRIDNTEGVCKSSISEFHANINSEYFRVKEDWIMINQNWFHNSSITISTPERLEYSGVDMYRVCISSNEGGYRDCRLFKTKQDAGAMVDSLLTGRK